MNLIPYFSYCDDYGRRIRIQRTVAELLAPRRWLQLKFDVISDGEHNVVATMVVTSTSSDGYTSAIRPAREGHFLHCVEAPDDFAALSPEELHDQLSDRLRTTAQKLS